MQVKRKKEKKIPTQWARIIMLRLFVLTNHQRRYKEHTHKGDDEQYNVEPCILERIHSCNADEHVIEHQHAEGFTYQDVEDQSN